VADPLACAALASMEAAKLRRALLMVDQPLADLCHNKGFANDAPAHRVSGPSLRRLLCLSGTTAVAAVMKMKASTVFPHVCILPPNLLADLGFWPDGPFATQTATRPSFLA